MRWGRAAVLVLVLTAAGLYYAPLRQYFQQQDRYVQERATLVEMRRQNSAMKRQIDEMKTDLWIAREARAQLQLVPKGVQAFVVTGLPSGEELPPPRAKPVRQSLDWGDRLRDLLKTLID